MQFYNWFRLHQILDQLQIILGRTTHYVSTVTEQTLVSGKENRIETVNENLRLMPEYNTLEIQNTTKRMRKK